MPDMSIREFADLIGKRHPTVLNWIKEIEAETGQNIGQKQGPGKATILSEADQQLIATQKGITFTKAESPQDALQQGVLGTGLLVTTEEKGGTHITRPVGTGNQGSKMVLAQGGLEVSVYTPEVLDIQLGDSSKDIEATHQAMQHALDQFAGNQALVHQALRGKFKQIGDDLGTELAAIEAGAILTQVEKGRVAILERLGLVQKPQPGATQPSDS
jgi:hypothetical protein